MLPAKSVQGLRVRCIVTFHYSIFRTKVEDNKIENFITPMFGGIPPPKGAQICSYCSSCICCLRNGTFITKYQERRTSFKKYDSCRSNPVSTVYYNIIFKYTQTMYKNISRATVPKTTRLFGEIT